ncbi:unnamed protein product [Arctogadus glacialis]
MDFSLLVKGTLCELLVHYIKEADRSHDSLVAGTEDGKTWANIVEEVSPQLKDIPIAKSSITRDGKGFHMAFSNEESMMKAKGIMENNALETSTDAKVPAKIAPKLMLLDLDYAKYRCGESKDDKDAARAKLHKALLAKNPQISNMVRNENMTLEVIFIKEELAGLGSAVIKVDPRIRNHIIKNKRKVFLDMSAVHAIDQIHLTQCFACQKFGHKRGSQFCQFHGQEKTVCLYCAKEHESKNCSVKRDPQKHNCSNCLNSTNNRLKKTAAGHTSTSPDCPIHQRETQSVVARTAGLDPKNFIYQRTMSTRRQR